MIVMKITHKEHILLIDLGQLVEKRLISSDKE